MVYWVYGWGRADGDRPACGQAHPDDDRPACSGARFSSSNMASSMSALVPESK
ncbi:hypothetical protein R3J22_05980 [Trueperella bernardiae]|nr:hypothetical protein [Trueperella bernardiae]